MNIFNRFYLKLSLSLLVVLLVVGVAYIMVTIDASEQYFDKKNQKLNANIGEHLVEEIKPFVDGQLDSTSIGRIMHSMMAVNPSIEVYLLDTEGVILAHVAPYKKVKRTEVDTSPIVSFIEKKGEIFIKGDDPRNHELKKVFSAAPIKENGIVTGYAYVILASEESETVGASLWTEYISSIGGKTMLLALGAALLLGMVAIYFITRYLNVIIDTVKRFKEGELHVRIPHKSSGDLSELATNFNSMADTIVMNIEKMKSMESMRRELVANVSHDLRTPLTVIHGYVETLMMKEQSLKPEDKGKYLETILGSTEKLKKLVDDLFELSKLEAKQVKPVIEPFHISDLIGELVNKYELIAVTKNIKIESSVESEVAPVNADIRLIERVLQNLIDNALKFTPDGGTIKIEANQKTNHVEVVVSDTGLGIPEDQIPFIFDRYRKADKVQNEEGKVGSGLGLAIVKKILEIHNASIELKSRINQGTTFSFQLPRYQS